MTNIVYREITLHHPYVMRAYSREPRYLIREWTPPYQGPVCLTGEGHAHYTANLSHCHSQSHGNGIVWMFSDWHELATPIPASCGVVGYKWPRSDGPDLPLCSAGLIDDLNDYFARLTQSQAERESEAGSIRREINAANERMQLALF